MDGRRSLSVHGLPIAGRRQFAAAIATDSLGTGVFLPFSVLYFVRTVPLSAAAVGVALSLAGFAVLPAPLAVAPAIDRLSPKVVVAAGNLISSCAFGAYLVVHSQVGVGAAAAGAGLGQATFWTATRALIAEVASGDERRAWFALQGSIRNAGYGVGGLAGAAALGSGSPLAFKALVAVDAFSYLGAALLLLSWRQPSSSRPLSLPDLARANVRASYRSVLTDRALLGISGVNTAFVICTQVLTVVLSVYVVDTLHLPAWIAGVLFTLNTVLVAATMTPLTIATRRRPHGRVLRAAAATWAVAFGLLWAADVLSQDIRVGVLVAAIVVFSAAEMLEAPVVNVVVTEIAPALAPGRYLSVYQLSWSLGQAIAPVVLLGLLHAGPPWVWTTAIALCAAVAVSIDHLVPARVSPATGVGRRC